MEIVVEPSFVNYSLGYFQDCCVIDCPFCVMDCRADCGSYGDPCWVDVS